MIFDTLTTIASGGILGVCGSLINKAFTLLQTMQQSKAKQQAWEHEKTMLELTQRYQLELAEKNIQLSQEQAASATQQASYQQDSHMGEGSLWVINILRLVRPVLTVGLIILTAMIWQDTRLMPKSTLHQEIASAIIFATTAALSWWFGDRVRKG